MKVLFDRSHMESSNLRGRHYVRTMVVQWPNLTLSLCLRMYQASKDTPAQNQIDVSQWDQGGFRIIFYNFPMLDWKDNDELYAQLEDFARLVVQVVDGE